MADPISSSDWYSTQYVQSAAQRSSVTSEATLGMQDFIKLLVAQMQNQDMMNPMDNTEFISQMATFSTLTAINNMAEQSTTSYALSLLGQEATAAVIDSKTGKLHTVEGVITGVSLFEGVPKIYIGDESFTLQSLMSVGKLREEPEEQAPPPPPPPPESGETDNGNNEGEKPPEVNDNNNKVDDKPVGESGKSDQDDVGDKNNEITEGGLL